MTDPFLRPPSRTVVLERPAPSPTPPTSPTSPTGIVLPSSDDPVARGAVNALGGPPGAHALIGERRFWRPLRVIVLLTLLTCGLAWGQKADCRAGSDWQHEFQYTRGCYSDIVALYSAEGLSSGQRPYYDHPVEYPVVTGAAMAAAGSLARTWADHLPDRTTRQATDPNAKSYAQANSAGRHFYDLTWALLTVCALVVAVTTSKLAGRRPWDAVMFALAPGLLLHLTTNWDLIAGALTGLAMLAWARRHPAWAGVLLGLGVAAKLYPLLLLVPLVALALRAGKARAGFVVAGMTVLMALVVTLPVYLTAPSYVDQAGTQVKVGTSPLSRFSDDGLSALAPHRTVYATTANGTTSYDTNPQAGASPVKAVNAVYRFYELNTTRGADWDSLYLQLQHLHGTNGFSSAVRDAVTDSGPTPRGLNRIVAVLVVLVFGAIALLALLAPVRPRFPQLAFLTITGFLLVNKVDSPQYVLWLLPLAVLARPRWRPFLAWQFAEALVLMTRFLFFIQNDKPGEGIGIGWFFTAVLVRDALLLVFAAFVVRDIYRPWHDVVREGGVDDPAGGVLDGARGAPPLAETPVLQPA